MEKYREFNVVKLILAAFFAIRSLILCRINIPGSIDPDSVNAFQKGLRTPNHSIIS
jgi:prenyltransferase beta subunit